MNLSTPVNTKARVLYALITKGSTSLLDFPYLAGFRTRISEIKLIYNVKLFPTVETAVNRDGHSYYFKHHFLPLEEVNNAIQVYNLINKSKN